MNASRNRKLGVLAVVIVALAAGGAALAAGKLHGSSTTSGPGGGPPGYPGGPGGGFRDLGGDDGGPFGGLSAATAYLGISDSELRSQLASGKTLAQIAGSTSGKSAAGLIDALVAAQKKELDRAVASGRISHSTADRIESNLRSRVTDMVNGTFHRFGGAPPGLGDPDGGRQQQAPTTATPSTHI
jgi:ribosomal protein S20